ncbi:hypothetical protein PR003_g18961 [Phytophthora rubi]|uniref:Uncharacterized protein n=2 Tax=Phytophthora TaxID=4783 RepID=A0A6A4EC43_9STRA|nr:hypothetical protein PR001_g15924 [Phytophthora rubi]KAE9023895.1 hypothetical protein PR002_g11595 [Phytophthora rubi]KAE9314999.1 hypothetical protein PF008_g19353 [Phytophthora fragariae]KAE9315552.1 hypothetical protein PR003_g18961 [Phytophthora rubi]
MRLNFDAGKMDDIPNTVFHSYNLRSISSQRNVRMEASPDDRIDKHVAHYVGLDVGLTLNNALPPEQRVDSGKLRNALNIRKNMDLASRDENLKLHKKVDNRLINFDDHGTLSDEEYERLVQIVKHARSHEFQQAMINVNNGRFVYLALRDRISSFDTGNRQRLWNARTDPSKLKRPSTKSKSSRSPE